MGHDFEIFCSYTHGDNDDGWVEGFVAALISTYRKLTGQGPRVFLDRESIITGEVWEQKIRVALEASQILMAVISPSFIRSEWCRQEWNVFTKRETKLREQGFASHSTPNGRATFTQVQRSASRVEATG